jgi:FkbM family methyltransferase
MAKTQNYAEFQPLRRVGSFINLIRLVRNWMPTALAYVSPFVQRDGQFLVETRSGLKFILRPKYADLDPLGPVLVRKSYTKYFPVGGTVVDVGAHIGIFTVFASSLGAEKVLAYEPSGNFELLQKNVEINQLTNVKAFNLAVAGEKGKSKLFLAANRSSEHTLSSKDHQRNACGAVDVETTTLEEIIVLNKLKRINFLKMDCEGAELGIFSKMAPETLMRIDRIAMEYHNGNDKHIAQLLKAANFEVRTERQNDAQGQGMLYAKNKAIV